MGVESVGYGAVEVEVNAGADAVGCHESCVFLHLFFRVIVFLFLIPGVTG